MTLGYDHIHSAAAYLRDRLPDLAGARGVVLGSGLGAFADNLDGARAISYALIPHFPHSTVEGHKGQLVYGLVEGRTVLCMQGRVHSYEGYDLSAVVFGHRVMLALGVKSFILTNAAGGMHAEWAPGDLMVISDHINLTGRSVLTGPNDGRLGPRFPDMSTAYPKALRTQAHAVARKQGFTLREGVYLGLNGPQYETPAEIRAFQALGGDAVGMSTVHETVAIRHGGGEVLGISCITNLAAGISPTALSHAEVKEAAQQVEARFVGLLRGLVQQPSG